jgi:hypothetical protein
MYMMHQGQQQAPGSLQSRSTPQNVQMIATPEAGVMSFDDLIGGEEWANTFMDQGYNLTGAGGTGFGGNPAFGPPGGPGMQNWR